MASVPISLFAKQETIVVHETKSLKSPISSKMDFALAQSPRNLLKRKEKKEPKQCHFGTINGSR